MQSLQKARKARVAAPACAAAVLDAVPPVMRFIRAQMRRHRGPGLSVTQFRALLFVNRRPRASLTALAEQLGLSLGVVSRLVDGLVRAGLVERVAGAADRRRVALSLSGRGRARYRAANAATRRQLAAKLAALSGVERGRLCVALGSLDGIFAQEELGGAGRPEGAK